MIPDKLGNEVNVGDDIIYSLFKSTLLERSTIVSFSPNGRPQVMSYTWSFATGKPQKKPWKITLIHEFIKV